MHFEKELISVLHQISNELVCLVQYVLFVRSRDHSQTGNHMSKDPQFDAIIGPIANEFTCNLHGAVVPIHGLQDCPPQTRDSIDTAGWHVYVNGSELCSELACMGAASHFIDDCSNPHFQCCNSTHIGAGRHTMAECEQFEYKGPGSIGYVHGQVHPVTNEVNLRPENKPCDLPAGYRYKANCNMKGDHVGPCTQSSPELVHIPGHREAKSHSACANPECMMRHQHHMEKPCSNFIETPSKLTELPDVNDKPLEEPQGCPDQSQCPVKGEHAADETCRKAGRRLRKQFKSNNVTTMMRVKRLVRNTRLGLRNISIAEFVANIPLALGILNGSYALGMLLGITSHTMETVAVHPFALIISASFYALVFMTILSASSKRITVPASPRFDRFSSVLTAGYAALMTSCLFEVTIYLVGIVAQQR